MKKEKYSQLGLYWSNKLEEINLTRYALALIKEKERRLFRLICGIPQELILGPLIFAICINYLMNSANLLNLKSFEYNRNQWFEMQ